MSTKTRNLSNIDGANVGNPTMNDFTSSSFESYASDAAYEVDHGPGQAGDIYWNTTEKLIREHNGTAWQNDKTSFETQTDSTTTGSNQDITPNTVAQVIRFSNASLSSIRSIVPTVQKVITLVNAKSSGDITIVNESAGATAANRIVTGTGQDFRLAVGQAVLFVYDIGGTRWRMIGGGSGGLSTEVQSTGFTAVAGKHYLCNTDSAAFTATLPAGATGAVIRFSDDTRSWATNALTITPATGESIDSLAANASLSCDMNGGFVQLMWDGSRWVVDTNSTFPDKINGARLNWNTQLGEKNYFTSGTDDATGWVPSGAGITVTTETSAANIPNNATRGTAIKILRASGTDYVRKRFTLDQADYGKKFKIALDQKYGGTAGDYTIEVYSNTASNYGGTSTQLTLASSSIAALTGSFLTSVDMPGSTAPYIEVRMKGNSGTTPLYANGCYIGPGLIVPGAAVSEWQTASVTPNAGVWGTVANTFSQMRRVGSDMHLRVSFTFGTAQAATAAIPMPTGYTINTSALAASSRGRLGQWESGGSSATMGSNNRLGVAFCDGSSATTIFLAVLDDTTGYVKSNASAIVNSNSFASIECIIPIAEWAGSGTVNLGPGAQQEFAYNTNVTNTASDTTSFAYGPAGIAISTNWATGTAYTRRVRFQNPVQVSDIIVVEVQAIGFGNNEWLPIDTTVGGYINTSSTFKYGCQWTAVTGSQTDIDVMFSDGGFRPSGTFGTAVGTAWSVLTTVYNWRVRKANASSPVGFGQATSTQQGLVSYEDSGSFSIFLRDGSTTSSGTAFYTRVGKNVCISIPALLITSTSTSFSLSSSSGSNTWPTGLIPSSQTQTVLLRVRTNTTDSVSFGQISTAGVFTLFNDPGNTGWSASNVSKGVLISVVNYSIV